MRSWLARRLVRHIAVCYDRAYTCCVRGDREGDAVWRANGRWRERYLLPLARRLDREAMAEQMVVEGYWG